MVLGIVCIILELLVITYIGFRIAKSKQISLKDTAMYPILVIVSFVLILFGQVAYGKFDHWWKAVPTSLSGALSLLTMKIDGDLADLFFRNNYPLLIGYLLAYFAATLALFSISISLFKVALTNMFRFKSNEEELDFIFSLSEDAKTYIKNLDEAKKKQTVVILQKHFEESYKDERLFLDDEGVKFIIAPFKKKDDFNKTVNRLMKHKKAKKFYFVSFLQQESEIHDFITNAKAYLADHDLYDGKVQFVVDTLPSQRLYVRDLIEGSSDKTVLNLKDKEKPLVDESQGCVRYYDKYGIMAFDFIRANDFARSFPAALVNDDATIKNCKINLFVLGFGKVNQALVKDILINTQFVTKIPAKEAGLFELAPVRLETLVFDENKNSSDLQLSSGIMKYDRSVLDQNVFFELPEDYRSHIRFENEINAEGVQCFDKIRAVVSKEKEEASDRPIVNYYIVSLGTDFENAAIAQRLISNLQPEDVYNVVYVRTQDEIALKGSESDAVVAFGKNRSVLSYDNVIADKMFTNAKVQSCVYSGVSATEANIAKEWRTLSKIKQDSNLYSVASLPFKSSLLRASFAKAAQTDLDEVGFYDPDDRRLRTEKESMALSINERYPFISPSKAFSPRDVLAFSEHERWLAFEMSLGVTPMERSKIKTYESNKSPNELNHSCLTTEKGLVDYYRFVSALKDEFAASGISSDDLGEADVIQYDYNLMDNYIKKEEA